MAEELNIDRVFDASPERLWHALTASEALPGWFWPFAMSAQVDARPGGVYRLDAPAMGMAMDGTVTEALAPTALGLVWRWAGEPEETQVHVTVEPEGNRARLRLTHAGFALAGTRDDHIQGWNDCLDRLPAWLEANR